MPSDAISAAQDIPQGNTDAPILGTLRAAYARAIVATCIAEHAHDAAVVDRHSRKYGRDVAAHALAAAQLQERRVGRAFLAGLDEQDPCCFRCGCSWNDPCPEGCAWSEQAPGDPPLCTACVTTLDDLELLEDIDDGN